MYYTPDKATSVNEVGGGKIWTVEDDKEDDDLTGNEEFLLHFLIVSYLEKKIIYESWKHIRSLLQVEECIRTTYTRFIIVFE